MFIGFRRRRRFYRWAPSPIGIRYFLYLSLLSNASNMFLSYVMIMGSNCTFLDGENVFILFFEQTNEMHISYNFFSADERHT